MAAQCVGLPFHIFCIQLQYLITANEVFINSGHGLSLNRKLEKAGLFVI